ncbi:hypothetical protein NIS_1285 [Nitratiruptor sp. SB155-2]|nr:hypothetical protein NIS_1285 [Nitratiruptor sp. SB155-2]
MWKVPPHKYIKKIHKDGMAKILIPLSPLSCITISVSIEQIFTFGKETVLKIPHSTQIEFLSKRKYPRIEVAIKALLRTMETKPSVVHSVRILDLSEHGMKIALNDCVLDSAHPIYMRFQIDHSTIELEGEIVGVHKEEDGCYYNIKISKIDEKAQFLINK